MSTLGDGLLEKPGLDKTLSFEYLELGPELVLMTFTVEKKHLQPFGYLHGGVNVSLAESVASIGANLAAPEGLVAFGQEINANHLRPVSAGARLLASGRPLHLGRSTQVWRVEIRNDAGDLVCVSRCTLALLDRKPAGHS